MTSVAQLPMLIYKNRRLLESSKIAGCLKCCEIIQINEINSYTDDNQTCICPKCGHDTIICDQTGYEITSQSLMNANKYIFKKIS
jgi:hypothetical protein